jgi:hypothetical protein
VGRTGVRADQDFILSGGGVFEKVLNDVEGTFAVDFKGLPELQRCARDQS